MIEGLEKLSMEKEENRHKCMANCHAYKAGSSFLTAITAVKKQFVAFFDVDSLKGSEETNKCTWNDISNNFLDDNMDDGSLILALFEYYARTVPGLQRHKAKINQDPVDCLHKLADTLPIPGSYLLEVILVVDASEVIHPKDCISLYGFIERLQLWHQARTNVFDLNEVLQARNECSNSSSLEPWHDVIEFGKIHKKGNNLMLRPSVLWNGSVCLRNENGCHTSISGFELRRDSDSQPFSREGVGHLEQESRLLADNEIEVLKVMDDNEAPLHVYCSMKLKLTVRDKCDESTRYFLDTVQKAKLENLCFLGCILYDIKEPHVRKNSELNTKKWFEYINDKKTEYLIPLDMKKYLPKRCMVIIRSAEDESGLDVFLFKDIECFNGNGLYNFLCHEHAFSKLQGDCDVDIKWNLRQISDDDILKAKLSCLEDLLHSLKETEENDLLALLTKYREPLFDQDSRESHFIDIEDMFEKEYDMDVDYCAAKAVSPSQWPERLSWCHQEMYASISIRGSLKRFQSADNHMKLKGIPVAAENHYEDATENFSQIRKLFDDCGRPTHAELKKIPLVADRLFKQLPSEDVVKNLPFSKATQFFGHGIDYCLDAHNSLKLDAKITRIQDRFISDDTSCTWTQVQKSHSQRKNSSTSKRKIVVDENGAPALKAAKPKCQNAHKRSPQESKNCKIIKNQGRTADIVKEKDNPNEESTSTDNSSKESRSQRHQRRLKIICEGTLQKYGKIDKNEPIFERCVMRLFTLCKSFLKDLKTSEGLTAEMKRIAKCNVQQTRESYLQTKEFLAEGLHVKVVDFEKRGK